MTPRIRFVIGGTQKGGTTALATYLGRYADVCLPIAKEAHLFDAPSFDDGWTVEDVDARFADRWPPADGDALVGDATPLYMFDERIVRRIARYNAGMRWVLLLRNPADRAISQYHMERERGRERWPLLAALLLEPLRTLRHADDLSQDSPRVIHSYVARGRYDAQLDTLFRHFPREQVLLLESRDLRTDPLEAVRRVRAFLGLPDRDVPEDFAPVFEGRYARDRDRFARRLLDAAFARSLRRLQRRYGIDLRRR